MKYNTVMVIEDDSGIRSMTKIFLENAGYDVIALESGERALELLDSVDPHLILLDIEMSGIDGFTVCKEIRKETTVPIIFLTVRRDTLDKVKSFELGGDDFITKPFDFDELNARIQANIRRYYTYPDTQLNILKYDDLEIHLHNYKCYLSGEKIDLSAKEMKLLIHLAKSPNRVWSQEQLYNSVWGCNALGNYNTVKVHINYLRRKLQKKDTSPELIKTVRGFGYCFNG